MMIEMVTAKVFSLALNHLSKDILSNWEVIAVNQGSVDVQGKKVQSNNGLEVWVGSLSNNRKAVVLWN